MFENQQQVIVFRNKRSKQNVKNAVNGPAHLNGFPFKENSEKLFLQNKKFFLRLKLFEAKTYN